MGKQIDSDEPSHVAEARPLANDAVRPHRLGRMDFVHHVFSEDEEKGTLQVALRPDPRRYDLKEINGSLYYIDRYLKNIFPADMLQTTFAEQLPKTPVYVNSPTIGLAAHYAQSRHPAVVHEIETSCFTAPIEKALAHKEFQPEDGIKELVFLSVDICGASAKRLRNQRGFEKAYKIFLRELGTLVGQFSGSIYKTTGDGFIAFIDYPAFTRRCDAAIDLGLSMLVIMRDAVNPALHQAGLEQIKICIGADHGAAEMRRIDIPTTGYSSFEIASDALNRAVKIEQECGEDEFRIGRALYELIHVGWLQRAVEVPFDQNVGVEGYRTYRVI